MKIAFWVLPAHQTEGFISPYREAVGSLLRAQDPGQTSASYKLHPLFYPSPCSAGQFHWVCGFVCFCCVGFFCISLYELASQILWFLPRRKKVLLPFLSPQQAKIPSSRRKIDELRTEL